MSQSVFGAAAAVTMLNRAFNNSSPANAVFNNQVAQAGTTAESQLAFARTFAQGFASLTNAQLAERVMGNMGMLPNADLLAALTDYIGANAATNEDRGVIVLQLGQILATMENATGAQAIYAPQATAWNTEVEKSFIYSSNTSNTTAFNGDFPSSGTNPDQTFTLTTSVESRSGSTGNDTFSGLVDAGNASVTTLNAGDNLDGGAGTDALNLTINGTIGTNSVVGVTLAGIERLQVQNVSSGTQTVDLVTSTGYSTLATYGSNQQVTFNNVATLSGAEMSYGSGNLTINNASAAVAGTSDAMNLALKGQSAGTFTTNGIETLTVNATGAASGATTNIALSTTNNLTTLNITGDQTVALTASDNSLTTINASAATGAVTLDASAALGNKNVALTGGAGNDVITATGANASDTINGGEGTDRLVFTTTTGTTVLTNVSNVEQVRVNATDTAAGVIDAAVVAGATALQVSMVDGTDDATDTTVTISNLTTQSVSVVASTLIAADVQANALAITHAADTTADSLALSMVGVGNSTTAFVQSVTADNAETITLTSSKNTAGTVTSNKIASLVSADATSLTISGDAALEITATTATNLATINGSTATAALYIDAAGAKSTVAVTGGAGNDTIDGGTGANTLTGNAGNDLLAGAGGNDVISGGDGNDRIVDGALSAGGSTETLNQTAANLSVDGGAGNDTIVIASDMLSYQDTLTGGDGTDTLELTYDASTTTLAANGSSTGAFKNVSVEKIQLTGGTALTVTVNDAGLTALGSTYFSASGAGDHVVDASGVLAASGTVKFDASATTATGANAYVGGAAVDHFIGGTGINTVSFTNGVYLTASDTLGGGSGIDELIFASDNAATITTAQLGNVTGFEVIQLDDDGADIDTTAMSITLNDTVVNANMDSANTAMVVVRELGTWASGAYTQNTAGDDTGVTTINGSAVTAAKLYLVGAAGDDVITGGSLADTITGADGADSLTGADGADNISGGAGADTISGGAGNDTIDGGAGIDQITLGDGTDRVNYSSGGTAAAGEGEIITGFTVYGTSTVSGATGYDFIGIDEDNGGADFFGNNTFTEATAAGATLAAANFQSVDGSGTDADIDAKAITVIYGEGYASFNAMVTANTAGADAANALVAFWNTATQRAELWYTTDADNSGADEFLVAALVGVSLADMQGLTRDNFLIIE